MGSITISVDAGAQGVATKSFTVTNANLGRLAAWSKAELPQAVPNPTNEQALQAWAKYVVLNAKDRITAHEQRALTAASFDIDEA